MEIIPVIDLLDGCVVHAKLGDRQHYQPIQSSLCKSSEPLIVIQALLELYPFNQLYIADLNAIQKHGNHLKIIADIKAYYPQLDIWLDAGISSENDLDIWSGLSLNWVFGSESLGSLADYVALKKCCGNRHILSLDFATSGYQGPSELLTKPEHWPDKVIAMTLNRVGSNAGPNYQMLTELLGRRSRQDIYAAGGVRYLTDIQQLQNMHVSGVLVASALHHGKITSAELASLVG